MVTNAQKILLMVGIALSIVYSSSFYFLLEFWPIPSPNLSVDEVVQLYARNNIQFRLGVVLMMLSGGFWLPWAIVISVQMARDESGTPIWAITQGVGSVLGTALFLALTPMVWGIAAFSVDRTPELTVLMHESGWLIFITAAQFLPFQAFPVAVVALSKKRNEVNSSFPRWIGWMSIWMGITAEMGLLAQLFKTGPFAWNGLLAFYLPVVVYGAWVGAITFTLFRGISRQEKLANVPTVSQATI